MAETQPPRRPTETLAGLSFARIEAAPVNDSFNYSTFLATGAPGLPASDELGEE